MGAAVRTYAIAGLALSLFSCTASSRVPRAISRRPIALPAGVHSVGVGADLILATTSPTYHEYDFDIAYGVGLTDALGLHYPLRLSLGGPVADRLQLGVAAGVSHIGYEFHVRPPFPGDPRLPVQAESPFILDLGVGGQAKWQLGDAWALVGDIAIGRRMSGPGTSLVPISTSAGAIYDVLPWLSLGLGATYYDLPFEDEQRPQITLGGSPALLSFHVAKHMDLSFAPSWVRSFDADFPDIVVFGATWFARYE